jgi:hypothetical protein
MSKFKEIDVTSIRNWWDYGINPITGYESSNYRTNRQRRLESFIQETKYIKVYPSLSTIKQNNQSRKLSDEIYDKKHR